MNENEKMYYFYVKTCKRCEFFKILSDYETACALPNRGYYIMTDSRVGPKFFAYWIPITLAECPYFNKITYSHIDQYESKSQKYQSMHDFIYHLLLIGWWKIIPTWILKKGNIKIPTKKEIEAEEKARRMERAAKREALRMLIEAHEQARLEKWSAPIKSAHIIRMERGLRTGLGNRRPYPHGRRTKKY